MVVYDAVQVFVLVVADIVVVGYGVLAKYLYYLGNAPSFIYFAK